MTKPPVFTTPRGHTATTRTVRRYALIYESADSAAVIKRSDSAETLATYRRRLGAHTDVDYFIGDTHTVRLRRVHPSGRIESPLEEAAANLTATYGGVPAGDRRPFTDSDIPDGALDRALAHLTDAHGPVAEAAHVVDCGPPLGDTIRRLAAEVAEAEYAARDTALDSSLASEPVTGYLQAAAAALAGAVRSLKGDDHG